MSLDEKNLLISVNPCLYSFSFLAVGEVLYNLCLPQSHKKNALTLSSVKYVFLLSYFGLRFS